MSNVFLTVWFVAIVGILGLASYAIIHQSQVRDNSISICEQMGGISVVGDRGHYKVCLRPSAVIDLPTQ
jgi:hypothetical protein